MIHLARVSGLLDGGRAQVERLFVVENVGRKATLITDGSRVQPVSFLDLTLQVRVNSQTKATVP